MDVQSRYSERCKSRRTGRAFTLIEVLVAVGIIGVLVAMLLPVFGSVRADARSTKCLNNLRQIWNAIEVYRIQNRQVLPYAMPLPAPGPNGPVGGLPEALKDIVPRDDGMWISPADFSPDRHEIGTSYVYVAGAFMIVQPHHPQQSPSQNIGRIARHVTREFEDGMFRHIPLVADSEDRHRYGTRLPRNVVMITGEARHLQPADGRIPVE